MKVASALVGILLSGVLFADSDLLFKATFDGYNTAPEFAASGKVTPGGIQPDLQMRMDHGEAAMKNVLSLTNPEFVSYPMAGNFRPDRGTVSFWVKPANYNIADVKTFQMWFTAKAPNLEFYIYKFTQRPSQITVYYKIGDVTVCIAGDAKWREGDWHKIDLAWDPNEIVLYVDGKVIRRQKQDAPVVRPLSVKSGEMTLNCQKGFNPTVDGRETGYDGLEIYGRKLTAKEVFENYRKVRPDAKADDSVNAAIEPPRVTYQCLPDEKKLVVRLDIWSADLKNRDNVSVELALVSRTTGKAAVEKSVVFPTPDSTVDFELGESLKEGETYDLVATIPAAKTVSKAKLHVPNMDFLRNRSALDGSVPPPWTKVKVEKEGVYSVLDRTYTFKRGILPTSIICRGEEMLNEAPRFELDGASVDWQAPKLRKQFDDHVTLSAEGSVNGFKVRGRADLWFDGFCELKIRFMPGNSPKEISSLKLKWSVPNDAARYLLTPYYRPWQADGKRYDGKFGYEEYTQDQFLWTTGVEKGLCWWCESRANWVGSDGTKELHVVRGEDQAEISVDIITTPVKLAKDANYTMGFQATPVKRPERVDRSRSYSAGGTYGNWTTGGWGIEGGRQAPDNMEHWTSFVPMDPKAFGDYIAARKAKGMEMLSYGQPMLLSVNTELWDYFNVEWCRKPYTRQAYTGLDKKTVPCYFCCGNTGAADWQLGNIERLFENYPDHRGLYFDISDVKFCDNELHGHGGVDAFGRHYLTSTALGSREFFMRAYKLAQRNGRWLHVHAHNKYYPFAHTFANACWPGEEQYYAYANDPENHYLEGIGEEEYQAAWNPVIRGMDIYMIAQNSRASGFGDFKDKPEMFFSERSVMTSMMPALLYDFKSLGGTFGKSNGYADRIFRTLDDLPLENAAFHGYWFDPHAVVAKGVRTALYTWQDKGENGFLLVVGNTSRNDLKTALKIDWTKTGTKPSPLTDLVTGETKTETEWAEYTLGSHRFLMLVKP